MPTIETTAGKETKARVLIHEGFVWDAQDAYLFDIDGTLLRSRDRIHFNSFASSIREVTGLEVSLSGVVLHGGTDPAILREAFELSGVPAEAWEPQVEAILEAMRHMVVSRRGEMDMWTMPAVAETLAHLAKRGALLGLATGNLELIGWTKVEEVGLREWFRFGGFSDRFSVRSEMVAYAAAKARELLLSHPGRELMEMKPQASVCVVGDTPRDIEAAHANRLPVIAVATGNYSFNELADLKPEVCASSLAALLAETVTDDSEPVGVRS
jgi:phosphoglycolate phosphatase